MKISELLAKETKTLDTDVATSLYIPKQNSSLIFQASVEPSLRKTEPLVNVRPSIPSSYPTGTFKLNSIVGGGIKIASINTTAGNNSINVTTNNCPPKPLVLKSFILPNQQQKNSLVPIKPVDTQKNANNQSISLTLNKLPNAIENVNVTPYVSAVSAPLSQPVSTSTSSAPIVLRMKTQTINKLIPMSTTISPSSTPIRSIESNRQTIRCLLDPKTDFSRKMNEKVLHLPASCKTNMACLKILQPKPPTINFINSSYTSSNGSGSVIRSETPQLLINNSNKNNKALSNNASAHTVLVDDTKMGPNETFVFNLGLSLVQNYEKLEDDDVAKEFVYDLKHSCPLCDFKCDTELIMDTHLSEPHSSFGSNALKCFYCQSVFRLQDDYRKHMRVEHNRICKLEKPYNKNACNFCDYESVSSKRGHVSEKLINHVEIDCPFSKVRLNASKKNLLKNLQSPSYIDCLNSAFSFNKKSIGDMCVDKYGEFKFYSLFKNLDTERMNLLNNIKLLESLLGTKSPEKLLNETEKISDKLPSNTTSVKLSREKNPSEERFEPVAKKIKASTPSQIMCDLCQVMFVNEDNTRNLLTLLRDHLFKFHMIRNISQLDNIVERAYLKLLGVNGTITVGVPPPLIQIPVSSNTLPATNTVLKLADHKKMPSSSTNQLLEESSDEEVDSLPDVIPIEFPSEQLKPRGLTKEQKLEIIKYHQEKPHLRQTDLIYFFEKKFDVQIAKSTMSDLLNGKGLRKLELKEKSIDNKFIKSEEIKKNLKSEQLKHTKLEEQLLCWLNEQKSFKNQNSNDDFERRITMTTNKENISDEMIIAKTKEFGEYLGVPPQHLLNYDTKWLENFKKKFNVFKADLQCENKNNDKAKNLEQDEIVLIEISDENKKISKNVNAEKLSTEATQSIDQEISLNTHTNSPIVQFEKEKEETQPKIVESISISIRQKSKNIIYDQLLSRAFSVRISASTRILLNLAHKIEDDIFKKIKLNSTLDYDSSIVSTSQKIGSELSDVEFLKIFKEKNGFESEFHTKFISLNKKTNLLEVKKTESSTENRKIKCDFCKWESEGTNLLYTQHLLNSHMKRSEVKLQKIDDKLLNDLSQKSLINLTSYSI